DFHPRQRLDVGCPMAAAIVLASQTAPPAPCAKRETAFPGERRFLAPLLCQHGPAWMDTTGAAKTIPSASDQDRVLPAGIVAPSGGKVSFSRTISGIRKF